MKAAVTHACRAVRKGFSGKRQRPTGKAFPHGETWRAMALRETDLGQSVLALQLVFVDLVVDAAWRDPEEPGRSGLIAARFMKRGFKQ